MLYSSGYWVNLIQHHAHTFTFYYLVVKQDLCLRLEIYLHKCFCDTEVISTLFNICTYHKLFTTTISEYPRILCTLGQRKQRKSAIYGLSPDVHLWTVPICLEYPRIPGYYDRGGRETPPSMGYPWMSGVDELHSIYGLSTDVRSIHGYSNRVVYAE